MRQTPGMLKWIAPLSLIGCASATGPASDPSRAPSPPTAEVVAVEPDYSTLYDELNAIEGTFREGLDLLIGGEASAGRATMEAASRRLAVSLSECSSLPGCDVDRFRAGFAALMALQNDALSEQVERVWELEQAALEQELAEEPGTAGFAPDLPSPEQTRALLNGTDLREIIELNGPVRAAIDDWLTWMRPNLMSAYENYQYLRPQMAPVFEQAGLPEALLFAMVATESGGKVHAYSRAGAAGPLQFMRRTGRLYGLNEVGGFDQRLDPRAATRAAVAYLEDRFKELDNSLEKALAAYNGGESRMRGLQRRYRDTSLWDSRLYYSLPRETRNYVPRVLAAAWLFLHPEDYNLQFPQREPQATTLSLSQDIALSELAICLSQAGDQAAGWFRTLRNLNPTLDPGERVAAGDTITLPADLVPAYEEHCLSGELLARAQELHDANYPPEPDLIFYTVRRGDTVGRIASRHGCTSIYEIGAINDLRAPQYLIRAGQRIKLPRC